MHFDWPRLTTVGRDGVGQVNRSSFYLARLPEACKWDTRSPGCGALGRANRDVHNLWPDTGQFILEKKINTSEIIARIYWQWTFKGKVWFIYMFKFQMEISIIDSIKLPSVSISKICTCRTFPERSLNSLKPGDILKIIHSNLFSPSMYVITCIERSHKGAYWWDVNIGSGNDLALSDNKPLPGPFLSRLMTPYGVTMPQMSPVFISHCQY